MPCDSQQTCLACHLEYSTSQLSHTIHFDDNLSKFVVDE